MEELMEVGETANQVIEEMDREAEELESKLPYRALSLPKTNSF